MIRTAAIVSIIILALFPVLTLPFLGLEKAAWCAAISATLAGPLISFHASLQFPRNAEDTQQKSSQFLPDKSTQETSSKPRSRNFERPRRSFIPSTQQKRTSYIFPFITTTSFGIVSGFSSLILNSTHGGWHAVACGMVLMFTSGVVYEKWTATARKDRQHIFRSHIAANSCLFGLMVAPGISGGPGQLAASLDGTGPENFATLVATIGMGAVPAGIAFRVGMLTAGGYEARNRRSDIQREKQREKDWERIRPFIGPAVAIALVTWLCSWLVSAMFGHPEYGMTIGAIMALVIISVEITTKSAEINSL